MTIIFIDKFQFHKGAIRTGDHATYCNKLGQFQFHKGAIRTTYPVGTELILNKFQFHKGAIRTSRGNLPDFAFLHFNSIKVRLEQSVAEHQPNLTVFQFHKGAIRTKRS